MSGARGTVLARRVVDGPAHAVPHDPAVAGGQTLRAVGVVFAAVFLWILANVLVHPLYGPSRYARVPVVVLTLALTAGLPFLNRWLQRRAVVLEDRPFLRREVVALVLLGFFFTTSLIGIAIHFPPGWDAQSVQASAEELSGRAGPGTPVDGLVAMYPNNYLLVAVLTRADQAAWALGLHDLAVVGIVVNAAALTTATGLAYLVARRVVSPGTGYLVLMLSGALVTLSPWAAVTYSDTVGMVFPVAVLALYLRLRETRGTAARLALWVAIAFVGHVGYRIKPTLVFALVAVVLVTVLTARLRTSPLRLLLQGGLVAGALAAGLLLGGVVVDRVVTDVGLTPAGVAGAPALPMTHFLKMGAQRGPGFHNSYYGAYDLSDVASTMALAPGHERFWGDVRTYRDRVAAMGPVGYAAFLNDKADWTFGDGTFFMYGEGDMARTPTPFMAHDALSRTVQRYLGFHGDRFALTVGWQTVWLATLLLCAAPLLLRDRRLHGVGPTAMRLALLLLLAFLLLFETRARYVYCYVPFFLLLAALSVDALSRRLDARVST